MVKEMVLRGWSDEVGLAELHGKEQFEVLVAMKKKENEMAEVSSSARHLRTSR